MITQVSETLRRVSERVRYLHLGYFL